MSKSKRFQFSKIDYQKILKSAFISLVAAFGGVIVSYLPLLQETLINDIQSSNLPIYIISGLTALCGWITNAIMVYIKDNTKK